MTRSPRGAPRAGTPAWLGLLLLAALGDAGGLAIVASAQGSGAPPADPAAPEPSARPAAFPFSDAAFEQLEVEARLDSLRVVFGNGLPPETMPVRPTPDGPCLTLGDVARLAGGAFRWDPRTWRGSFEIDTLEVSFTLDSPVFWVRETPVQLPSPARYVQETILLPIGVIDGLLGPLLGPRCQWTAGTGQLILASRPPWLETLALSGTDFQAALHLRPIDPAQVRLRWDPTGTLLVEGRGPRLRPGAAASPGRAEGIEAVRARTTARGFEMSLRLDSRWAGVRLRATPGDRSVAVELTAREADVYRGAYQPLVRWTDPRAPRGHGAFIGRTILVEVTPPPGAAGLKGDCLLGLADALKLSLETEFGHRVVAVPDRGENSTFRSPSGLPETPGAPPGDCWIGLRLEARRPGAQGEFTFVVPRPVPRRAPLGVGALASDAGAVPEEPPEGERPAAGGFEEIPPWGQVARLEQTASERLARTLADHIDYTWADRPVRIHPRPSRIFRGLGLPAVLIYPAAADDEPALDALCDSARVAELARNLAFGIDEYLMTRMNAED